MDTKLLLNSNLNDIFIKCPEENLLSESWLTEGENVINFKCPSCNTAYELLVSRRVPCNYIGTCSFLCNCSTGNSTECEYMGTNPRECKMMYKTTFDKNGRQAVRINFSGGKSAVRSKTKDNVMEGKKSESVLTRGCSEASKKAKEKIVRDRAEQMKNFMAKQERLRRTQ